MTVMTTGARRLPVTLVTENAGQDGLSGADYREIYDEVRGFDAATGKYAVSLDDFVVMVRSAFSKAAWSKYHRGELELNRVMRNELRAAVGLPLLPPSVAEVVAGVDVDAQVVRVGDELVRRVVLVGTAQAVTVACNGAVQAWVVEGGQASRVTRVTRGRKAVFVAARLFDRVNALRLSAGLSWADVLVAAERALTGHASSVADGAQAGGVGAAVGVVLD